MKPKNQNQNNYSGLEKVIAVAGLSAVILGLIANLFGAFENRRFMHNPLDLVYYYRYMILLGGGFVAGLLFANKTTVLAKIFNGTTYAVLGVLLFTLIDLARLPLGNILGELSYKLFILAPVLALGTLLILAFILQNKFNVISKSAIVSLFLLSQLLILANGLYYLFIIGAQSHFQTPIWEILISYLTAPLVIAGVSYLFLQKLNNKFDRIFFSVLIGSLYGIFMTVVWEFRTDPSAAATTNFGYAIAVLSLLYVGMIIWRSRLAVR